METTCSDLCVLVCVCVCVFLTLISHMCFVRLVALSKVCVSECGRVFFFVRTRQSLTHLWKERKKEKKSLFLFNFEEEISDVFHDYGFYVILTVKYQENSTGAE